MERKMTGNGDNIRDKLRARIAGAPAAGQLGGGARGAIEDKTTGQAPRVAQPREILYHPLEVYLVTDSTMSMSPVIEAVSTGMRSISTELLETPDKGEVAIAIWSFTDHLNDKGLPCIIPRPLRRGLDALLTDIKAIQLSGNPDDAEAYECAFLSLAEELAKQRPQDRIAPKKVAVIFGDMVPHELLAKENVPHTSNYATSRIYTISRSLQLADGGCPDNIDYRQSWRALTTAADLTVFVGCSEHSMSPYKEKGVDRLQATIVDATDSRQKYVSIAETRIIPALIMASARLAQSPAAAQEYLKRLAIADAGTAKTVAGYLSMKH